MWQATLWMSWDLSRSVGYPASTSCPQHRGHTVRCHSLLPSGCTVLLAPQRTFSCYGTPEDVNACAALAGYGYRTRQADSEGIAVGALAVPWALSGALLSALRHQAATGAA